MGNHSTSGRDFLARRAERRAAEEIKLRHEQRRNRALTKREEKRLAKARKVLELAERPMPARKAEASAPVEYPYVQVVVFPRHEAHYRTTLKGDSGANTAKMAYVAVNLAEQVNCLHEFGDLDRFGGGLCRGCHANAFSPWWVAAGIYGEDAGRWAMGVERSWKERASAKPVVAGIEINLDAPAKRTRLTVPPMKPGAIKAAKLEPGMEDSIIS